MANDSPSELLGPWHRVHAIPAPEAGARTAETDFVAVLPAALSAAHAGLPFTVCWLSRGAGRPLELITNAGPLAAPQRRRAREAAGDTAAGPILFPAGSRGAPIGDGWVADLADLVWTTCPVRQAVPLTMPGTPALFEHALMTMMSRPFAWLVVAEPSGMLPAEVEHLRTQLNVARRYDTEQNRSDVERAERRIQELETFREGGLWNVRVLAGAASAEELRQIAPVLVGSLEMSHHPYRIRSGAVAGGLRDALAARHEDRTDGAAVPYAATAGALAALAGLPRREVPGLRVLESGHFDVTSESDFSGDPGIALGSVMDEQDRPVGEFRVPLATLNRHVFVTGATGSGKSQTVRQLLERLTGAGVPWLVIEPAKAEYAAMAGRIDAPVTVINPSDPQSVPLSVNPLAPEPGYPVQAHIDMVRALFAAAFDAEEPFPQIMSQALQRVYEAGGWDVVTGAGRPGAAVAPAVPTLEQLQNEALDVIRSIGYGPEVQADVEGFVSVRLRSLRVGSAGRFFEGGHPADIGELLRTNVVLAIEDVANDEDKAFLMGTLIMRIVEHLRMRFRREKPTGLRHVTVIEEAHRLLRGDPGPRASAHAVELFAGMLAETRAYGEGIVVAEQIPTKLAPDVVKNTALKVTHRLPAADDRHVVGTAMNLADDQSRQVVSLVPGVAAAFADGMDRPVRIRMPLGEDRERSIPGPVPPIGGRRSVACGRLCREVRPCSLYELREADLGGASPEWAWLRVWAETLVLAFCTNRALPRVPPHLGQIWAEVPERFRECLFATVTERAVMRRAWALRTQFDPAALLERIADVGRALSGEPVPMGPPGVEWVIPQVQWLHEAERLFPYGMPAPHPKNPAPPMEYELFGPDSAKTGELLGHRARALRHHPLSMESERNRAIAWHAIVGDDDAFRDDLPAVGIGVEPKLRVNRVAVALGVEWLEAVMAWPTRFIETFEEPETPMEFPGTTTPATQ